MFNALTGTPLAQLRRQQITQLLHKRLEFLGIHGISSLRIGSNDHTPTLRPNRTKEIGGSFELGRSCPKGDMATGQKRQHFQARLSILRPKDKTRPGPCTAANRRPAKKVKWSMKKPNSFWFLAQCDGPWNEKARKIT